MKLCFVLIVGLALLLSSIFADAGCVANCAGSSPTFSSTIFRDITIANGGTNVLDIRNGTNATKTLFFNTYSSSTNNEFFAIDWQTTANTAVLSTNKGSGGGTARTLSFRFGGTATDAIRITSTANSGLFFTPSANINNGSAATIGSGSNLTFAQTTGTGQGLQIIPTVGTASTSAQVFYGINITPTVNYSNGTPGAGHYEMIRVAVTETALQSGTNYLMWLGAGAAGATTEFSVMNSGEVYIAGVSEDGSGKAICVKADKTLGSCSDAVGAGGTCTCG